MAFVAEAARTRTCRRARLRTHVHVLVAADFALQCLLTFPTTFPNCGMLVQGAAKPIWCSFGPKVDGREPRAESRVNDFPRQC